MALTQRTAIDRLELVGEDRVMQVRVATIIEDNGVELSRSFNRYVVTPDDDVSAADPVVKAVANTAWTPAVRALYAQNRARSRNP